MTKNWRAALLALLVLLASTTANAVESASYAIEIDALEGRLQQRLLAHGKVEEDTDETAAEAAERLASHRAAKFDMFSAHNETTDAEDAAHGHAGDHHEPGHACLFPSLILMVGLVVYYIISR